MHSPEGPYVLCSIPARDDAPLQCASSYYCRIVVNVPGSIVAGFGDRRGMTVIDFGTIALFGQAGAHPAHRRLLCTGGCEPRRARRSTRVYPTSDDESVVTGRFVR